MIFTVEPGVYVAGKYGVRIEDDVTMGKKSGEVTTRMLPKEFGWWQ
jgi:Xaa-Pro dipeptidase